MPDRPMRAPRPRARRRARVLGAWAAAVPLGLATAAAATPPDLVLAELGEPYYRTYCASCHGLSGKGDGPVASALSKRPSDLTRIAARRGGRFPEGEIGKFIDGRFDVSAHGPREMPVWGDLLAADVPDPDLADQIARGKIVTLIEYLKSIQVPPLKAGKGAKKPD